jgi:hypothetical protein
MRSVFYCVALTVFVALAASALRVSKDKCPIINTDQGTIDLNYAPNYFLRHVPFSGDSGGSNHADLGIGLCHHFDSSNYPCRGHSNGYLSLSAISSDGTPVCLTTFGSFSVPWYWNGNAVQADLSDYSNSFFASAILNCGNVTNYEAAVSEDSTGTNFNITITTPYACPT